MALLLIMNLPFFQMNKKIKDSFVNHLDVKIIKLTKAGPTGPSGPKLGTKWHKLLKDSIKGEEMKKFQPDHVVAAKSFLDELKSVLGIEILDSDFCLYGFMYSESELSPRVYFWHGDADAIGYYYNKKRGRCEYVIVDWKVKRDLLNFWISKDTFGMYLHQGLLYAKLLQLHLKLDYLPSFLLVPISSDNGSDVHPGLFSDYPDECKELINHQFWWGTEPPALNQRIYAEKSLLQRDVLLGLKEKNFDKSSSTYSAETPLKVIFDENATVGDLLKALGSDAKSLTIIPSEKSEDN